MADNEKFWWTCGSGRIELEFTRGQFEMASHTGRCDDDVAALLKMPDIAAQVAAIDPTTLANELREYGAWEDAELANHDDNLQRVVWIACGDLSDEHCI